MRRGTRILWPLLAFGCTAPADGRPALDAATPLLAVAPAPVDTGPPALLVRFLDVGQGDAVLLSSGGKHALVDTGPADRIASLLRQRGVDTLDLLVASHNHADHIGGADAVLDSFPVRFYLDNGYPATTRTQERVLERVERHGVRILRPTRRTIGLGRARLRILPPPARVESDGQNNRSVGLIVELGSFEALLTGDSETEEIHVFLARDTLPDVEVLKAAHHGSRNGVTPGLLARVRPEVVVISLGRDNPYGHPHPSALRYYCASGRRVLRTDRHGEVVVEVDSSGEFRVWAERGEEGCRR